MKEIKSNNNKTTTKKEPNILPATEVRGKTSDLRKHDLEVQQKNGNNKVKNYKPGSS